jgi:hypothetical protein
MVLNSLRQLAFNIMNPIGDQRFFCYTPRFVHRFHIKKVQLTMFLYNRYIVPHTTHRVYTIKVKLQNTAPGQNPFAKTGHGLERVTMKDAKLDFSFCINHY